MVGDFRNKPDFNPETHILTLKPEYDGVGDIIRVSGQIQVIFNSETVTSEYYPYYFYNGLDDIFDVISI
jgi:phosphotransferase system IIB component